MAQIVLLVMIVPLVFGLFMQIFITQANLPPVIFLPLMVWSHLRSYPLDSLMWLYILTAIVIGFKETWKWWKRGKTHSYD